MGPAEPQTTTDPTLRASERAAEADRLEAIRERVMARSRSEAIRFGRADEVSSIAPASVTPQSTSSRGGVLGGLNFMTPLGVDLDKLFRLPGM